MPLKLVQHGQIDEIYEDPPLSSPHMTLHYGDLTDATNLIRIVRELQTDEIYNQQRYN